MSRHASPTPVRHMMPNRRLVASPPKGQPPRQAAIARALPAPSLPLLDQLTTALLSLLRRLP